MPRDNMRDADARVGPIPSQTGKEIAAGLTRAAITAIPMIGGVGAELMAVVLQPALEARRDAWLERLGLGVDELRERFEDFDPRSLADNELFVTVALNASLLALRTHQEEKLEALKNAVVSAASPMAPDEHTQMMFLRYIEEFSPMHLRILAYVRSPREWFEREQIPITEYMAGSRSTPLEQALPELAGRAEVYNIVIHELVTRGLMSGTVSGMVSGPAVYDSLVTQAGERFLRSITGAGGGEGRQF